MGWRVRRGKVDWEMWDRGLERDSKCWRALWISERSEGVRM